MMMWYKMLLYGEYIQYVIYWYMSKYAYYMSCLSWIHTTAFYLFSVWYSIYLVIDYDYII
jgi:hypothetical protein